MAEITRTSTSSSPTHRTYAITPSANTNLSAAYFTGGGITGGSVGSFQYPEFTAEIWLRPGNLTANYEVVFETGGGQNGLSILINEDELRFLGSALDVRTADLTIPLAGLDLTDFIQVFLWNSVAEDRFELYQAKMGQTLQLVSSIQWPQGLGNIPPAALEETGHRPRPRWPWIVGLGVLGLGTFVALGPSLLSTSWLNQKVRTYLNENLEKVTKAIEQLEQRRSTPARED